MPNPQLMIGDDHGLVADGLRLLLEPHYRMAGVFGDGTTLVRAALERRPDLILSDIRMPGLNGLQVCEGIRAAWPEARVVILSMYHSVAYLRRAEALGARGFLSKDSAGAELLKALRVVLGGGTYFQVPAGEISPTATGPRPGLETLPSETLTVRQREIVLLVAQGFSAKEVAARIGISPRTVEFHKHRMMRELGLRSSSELVAYAIRSYPAELGETWPPAGGHGRS
ncbi:MAG: response regulator [Verrucomicrobiota bacterium]